MKTVVSLTVCAVFGLASAAGMWTAQESNDPPKQPDKKEPSKHSGKPEKKDRKIADHDVWMKAKQLHAQRIFAGLTEGDFKKIENGASAMYGTGVLEKWMAGRKFDQTHVYEGQVNTFEYSIKELSRYARQKDIDGTLDSYIMMSRTCVRCHRMLRDVPEEI